MNTCLWMNTCLLMSITHNFGLVQQWWRVDCRPARRCRHTLPKWIRCTVRLASHTCGHQQADRFLVCNRIRILDCNGTKRKCKVFATFFVLFTDAYTDPRLLIRTRMHTLALPLLFRLFHISCLPCAYRYCKYPIESLEKRNNCILDLEAHCSRIIRHLTARCMNYIWDRLRVCAYRKHSLMAGQDDWESSLRPWFPPLRRQLEELHDRWPVRYPVS